MNLDREVRHKSEDIDDDVLMDAIKAMKRRVRIVNRFELLQRIVRKENRKQ